MTTAFELDFQLTLAATTTRNMNNKQFSKQFTATLRRLQSCMVRWNVCDIIMCVCDSPHGCDHICCYRFFVCTLSYQTDLDGQNTMTQSLKQTNTVHGNAEDTHMIIAYNMCTVPPSPKSIHMMCVPFPKKESPKNILNIWSASTSGSAYPWDALSPSSPNLS